MALHWWAYTVILGSTVCGFPTPKKLPPRKCEFLASSRNLDKVLQLGNVNGTVQYCALTQCCVGIFQIVDGQFKADFLGCSLADTPCLETTCSATGEAKNYTKCRCSTDLCNRDITWITTTKPSQQSDFHMSSKDVIANIAIILAISSLALVIMVVVGFKLKQTSFEEESSTISQESKSPCSCYVPGNLDSNLSKIELQKIMAHGYYGVVWQGIYQGNLVALKQFPTKNSSEFERERSVYTIPLSHHGIVRFLGSQKAPSVLVLEFASNGSLSSYLSSTTLNWRNSVRLAKTLADGLAYLHSEGPHKPSVAHGDLTSANVLVRCDGTCALCDFGCATIIHTCRGPCKWQGQDDDLKDCLPMGTLRYMAPEILEGSVDLTRGQCLLQADIYAMSLILWEVWTRCADLFPRQSVPEHHLPFEKELGAKPTREQLYFFVSVEAGRPVIPTAWARRAQDILLEGWDPDPEARLTASCIVDRLDSK